jgi:hypothetical protein
MRPIRYGMPHVTRRFTSTLVASYNPWSLKIALKNGDAQNRVINVSTARHRNDRRRSASNSAAPRSTPRHVANIFP